MTPALSIVIVNYNAGEHLVRCLDSVVACVPHSNWEAVVIDNASVDGSAAAVALTDSRIRLVQNHDNRGFGRAVNQGVATTSAPRVLFLNPDGRLQPGSVEGLSAVLDSYPDCAIAGPAVVNDDGTVQGSGRGDPDMMTGLFGRSTLLTRLFPRARLAQRNVLFQSAPAGTDSFEVDWVSGACMLVRRDAFERVGGFDERFFMYWEDADLCRRLRTAGLRTRYVPSAPVAHTVGRSSRTAPGTSTRAFHRSAYLYYVKHVAPSPFSPIRWMAGILLTVRCVWKLLFVAATRQRP